MVCGTGPVPLIDTSTGVMKACTEIADTVCDDCAEHVNAVASIENGVCSYTCISGYYLENSVHVACGVCPLTSVMTACNGMADVVCEGRADIANAVVSMENSVSSFIHVRVMGVGVMGAGVALIEIEQLQQQ